MFELVIEAHEHYGPPSSERCEILQKDVTSRLGGRLQVKVTEEIIAGGLLRPVVVLQYPSLQTPGVGFETHKAAVTVVTAVLDGLGVYAVRFVVTEIITQLAAGAVAGAAAGLALTSKQASAAKAVASLLGAFLGGYIGNSIQQNRVLLVGNRMNGEWRIEVGTDGHPQLEGSQS